jgi:hypothetical protein
VSFYRQLVSNTSPPKAGFDQWSIYVRFVANKVALAEVCLRVRRFYFSVSLKQFSILIFFYKLLLPKGKIDEVWGPPQNQCFFAEIIVHGIVKHNQSLGAFEELRKATVIFVMSVLIVCLSVCPHTDGVS